MTSPEGSQKGYAYRHLATKHPLQHLVRSEGWLGAPYLVISDFAPDAATLLQALQSNSGDAKHSETSGSAYLYQLVLDLAQMLHTLQQQQVTTESVASATMTHLALQVKQLEHKHADQQQQVVAALQQAAPGLLGRLDDLERDQQQQREVLQELLDSQVQQMQQYNSSKQLLQTVQQQCCKLEQRLDMVFEQQQHWQQKQEQLIYQYVVEALQQKQQDDQQCVQHLQERLCQQQQAASSLQLSVQGIAERLAALQDQLETVAQQQVHLLQDRQDDMKVAEASAAKAVRQEQLQDGLAGVESRLLHAMRLEAEAQQHLVELRVTANYERMKSDVAAAQKEIAMQLQQLTQELQDAMVSLSSQQSSAANPTQHLRQQQEPPPSQQQQHQEKQLSAGIDQFVLDKIMAARAARVTAGAQPADLALTAASSATAANSADVLRVHDQKQVVQLNRSQAGAVKQGATCQSGLTGSATALGLYTSSSSSDATAAAAEILALVKQPAPNLKNTAGAESGGSRRRGKGSPGKRSAKHGAAASGASPARKVLSDQEVDVVLHLLDALHAAA